MTITKITFGIFLIVLFFIYYIVPKKMQWIVLLAGNIYFYYHFGIYALIFLLGTIAFTYLAGLITDSCPSRSTKRLISMVTVVTIFVGLLVVMRVTTFASIIDPMGLSFYSLMCMGYVIDVQREAVKARKNPLRLALYLSYFPHIIQGPFDDYDELDKQLQSPHYFNYDKAVKGVYRIFLGLIKKTVIADRLSSGLIDGVFSDVTGYHGLTVVIVMVLYAFQLYCDFSGYMDIVCGASNIFDIDIKENFNAPFLSKSMAEFWRRWHMSLGLWFKNYVFYPIQRTKICSNIRKAMKKKGNKYAMTTIPSVIGLVFVWTLIGLWHGFDANYLFYDWFCGLVIIFSELASPVYNKINGLMPKFSKSKLADFLRIIRTFAIVCFSFLIFRSETISDFVTLFTSIFKNFDIYKGAEFIYWHSYDLFLIAPGIIALIILDIMKYKEIDVFAKVRSMPVILRYICYIIVPLYYYVCKSIFTGVSFAYSVF